MLAKAVAAVKADKAKAPEIFNNGEGGFRGRINISDSKFLAIGNSNAKYLFGVEAKP